MGKKYDELMTYVEKMQALGMAEGLFDWDLETAAPPQAAALTAGVMGSLSSQYFEILTSPQVGGLIGQAAEEELDETQRAIVRELAKERDRLCRIPAQEYREYAELIAGAAQVWARAKRDNDFASFAPTLAHIVEMSKKIAAYNKKEGQSTYDAMLWQYEEGFGQAVLDPFFALLREHIVPLLQRVMTEGKPVSIAPLRQSFAVDKQREFNRFLAEYVGFDFDRGVLAESEHPFTIGLHNHDVRITTHYYENLLESAMFSTIHESGHAVYEMNVDDALTLTPVAGGASCGMHESQSRLMENMIGRSPAFWEPLYPRLRELFAGELAGVSGEDFVRMINRVSPSLIRTEADELTYCLHVMIRYEIEKEMIDGSLDVRELPRVWNDKYEEYLGVRPVSDAEGVLQDIHWAQGSIGYFPSYALGNAFAAQIYRAMDRQIDIDGSLRRSDLAPVRAWLKEKIHRFGRVKPTAELLRDATGEDFNPQYYIDYLTEKFTGLYDLK